MSNDPGDSLSVKRPLSGPLRVHERNLRYFADGSGRVAYLTGSHTWLNLQDGFFLGGRREFDYESFLDRYEHNFFRLWAWESALWVAWRTAASRGEPGPVPVRIAPPALPTHRARRGARRRTDPAATRLQEAYVRKVIDAVNDLDNVLYEIPNESRAASKAWQYRFIDFVHEYEQTKPKQHPVLMSFAWDGVEGSSKDADLFESPAEAVAPGGEKRPDGSKVIIPDTDHLWGVGGDAAWAWKSFLRGMNPIFMDPYKDSPHHHAPESDPKWDRVRGALGDTRRYAERMDLAAMQPTASAEHCSTRYCLRIAAEC